MGEKCVLINLREFGKIIMSCSLWVYKGGFTRRAKAGDNNQQTADDVKTVILRPFTCTRLKGYYFSVNR